jgi:hypothetical protein
MADINKSGAAFPTTQYSSGVAPTGHSEGMSLRDYFAAKAMQGFCANPSAMPTEQKHFDNLAEDAFRSADAMLKAKKD